MPTYNVMIAFREPDEKKSSCVKTLSYKFQTYRKIRSTLTVKWETIRKICSNATIILWNDRWLNWFSSV